MLALSDVLICATNAWLGSALLACICACNAAGVSGPPGHMKPFGAHRDKDGDVLEIDGWPSTHEFVSRYATDRKRGKGRRVGTPFIVRQAAKEMPAWQKWRSDEQLLAEFGTDMDLGVEEGKKDGNKTHLDMSLKDFLGVYQRKNVYATGTLHPDMETHFRMPPFMFRGGLTRRLWDTNMWFSAGGTSSLIHADAFENVYCMFSGTKTWQIVSPEHRKVVNRIEMGWVPTPGYAKDKGWLIRHLDPVAMDLQRFPGWATVPYLNATLEAGDCMFLPSYWYHYVHSSVGRNLAVNFWFHPPLQSESGDVNMTPCAGDECFLLSDCDWEWRKPYNLEKDDDAQVDFNGEGALTSCVKQQPLHSRLLSLESRFSVERNSDNVLHRLKLIEQKALRAVHTKQPIMHRIAALEKVSTKPSRRTRGDDL